MPVAAMVTQHGCQERTIKLIVKKTDTYLVIDNFEGGWGESMGA